MLKDAVGLADRVVVALAVGVPEEDGVPLEGVGEGVGAGLPRASGGALGVGDGVGEAEGEGVGNKDGEGVGEGVLLSLAPALPV